MKIIEKPWGKEEVLERNAAYMVKRLTMRKGHKCSMQFHREKIETVYLLSGSLRIFNGEREGSLVAIELKPHEYITLKPFIVHRMEALEDSVYLESSTPQLEDVVRLEDAYGRAQKSMEENNGL